MIADMLNDEQVIYSGKNVEDSRSSATLNPSHDIRHDPLSLIFWSGTNTKVRD